MTSPATGAAGAPATYETLRARVQDRIASAELQTDREPERVRGLIAEVVATYQREATSGIGGRPLADPGGMTNRLARSVLGFGPLQPFIDATGADVPVEVKARGAYLRWKGRDGYWRTSSEPITEDELLQAIGRLLEPTGRTVTEAQPIISTQVLGNQARLTVSLPPISDEVEMVLRFYVLRHETLDDLVALDTITPTAARFVWAAMRHPRVSVLVTGPPQGGKTTFASALMRAIPNSHEVCCVEDSRELHAPLMHVSYRKTRPPTGMSDDAVEVTLRDLVRLALRSSPTRIVVGEVRGEEAAELTRAADAGAAVLATLHADNAGDALDALTNAAMLGGHNLPAEAVRSTWARTIDLVVHLDSEDVELSGGGNGGRQRRQVLEVAAVSPLQAGEDRFTVVPVFTREEVGAPLRPTGHPVPERLAAKLDRVLTRHGTSLSAVLAGQEATIP